MDLILVLTDTCNRNCRYCYANARRPQPMTPAIGKRAIRRALETRPTTLRIGYFGGEPLLEFTLLRRLTDYARQQARGMAEVAFHVSTNGDFIDDEVARYLGAHDFDVGLSAHDDRLEKCRHALDALLAAGIEPRVTLVADPLSAGDLVRRVDELALAGASKIGISPDYYADWDVAARRRLQAAYLGLARLYRRRKTAGQRFHIGLFDMRLAAIRSGVPLGHRHCHLGRQRLVIAPDGSAYPCDRMAVDLCGQKTAVGNVLSGIDVRKLDRLAAARRETPEQCASCRFAPICTRFCACVNVRLTGDICAVPETVCWHESMVGEIVYGLFAEMGGHSVAAARHRYTRLVRVTAGLLVSAGVLSASCRDEQPPSIKPPQSVVGAGAPQAVPEVWVTFPITFPEFQDKASDADHERASFRFEDARGTCGDIQLEILTRLSAGRLRALFTLQEDKVHETLRQELARIDIRSLAEPAHEEALGRSLLAAIGRTLDVADDLCGIRLDVREVPGLPEGQSSVIDAKMLEAFKSMGYVDADPE